MANAFRILYGVRNEIENSQAEGSVRVSMCVFTSLFVHTYVVINTAMQWKSCIGVFNEHSYSAFLSSHTQIDTPPDWFFWIILFCLSAAGICISIFGQLASVVTWTEVWASSQCFPWRISVSCRVNHIHFYLILGSKRKYLQLTEENANSVV